MQLDNCSLPVRCTEAKLEQGSMFEAPEVVICPPLDQTNRNIYFNIDFCNGQPQSLIILVRKIMLTIMCIEESKTKD